MKLNGTHQLLVYADVKILGESGLQVIADKTKYMVMYRGLDAERCYIIKIDSNYFERVEEFKYWGTTITNQILFRKKLRAD